MKELVVLSGKGGTGKTSVVASFAYLAQNTILADCDVDAADLHLILSPEINHEEDFYGGETAHIDKDLCTECGKCIEVCRFDAIPDSYDIDRFSCENCGICAHFCPEKAIEMNENISGKFFISDTRNGPLVHARLGIAEGNSGKLVSRVKDQARRIAKENKYETLIVDGPPGIGCPVIASLSGASLVLIVCEPTVSGIHDMKRVVEVIEHFRIKTLVCINKYDLNHEKVREIKDYCMIKGIDIIATIPYDKNFTIAQIAGKSIVEFTDNSASQLIKKMWEDICDSFN